MFFYPCWSPYRWVQKKLKKLRWDLKMTVIESPTYTLKLGWFRWNQPDSGQPIHFWLVFAKTGQILQVLFCPLQDGFGQNPSWANSNGPPGGVEHLQGQKR